MNTDPSALLRLMTWLSPAFPIGGFSYSHGLEAAIADHLVTDRESLKNWISHLVEHGSAWNDALLLAAAYGATDKNDLQEICELAEALCGSNERHLETMKQGEAFVAAAAPWIDFDEQVSGPIALPVALGIAARSSNIDPHAATVAFLQAFVSSQVQAALRLMPLGQTNSVRVQHELEPVILNIAQKSESAGLEALGTMTINAEIAAMRHETMPSRIFRS